MRMRLLRRNMTEFEYLPYDGTETDLNDDGEHTGEFHPKYGDPEIYRGNISAPSGQTTNTFYGEDIRYTHTLVMSKDVGITEHGIILWRGHTFEVTAVRPSLNAVSIALRRMTSDDGVPYVPENITDDPVETGETGETGGDEP